MVILVLAGRTVPLDSTGLQIWRTGAGLAPRGPGWLIEAVRDVTGMGGVVMRHVFAICAIAALLLLKLRREALVLAGTVMGGWVVNSALKALIGRERPTIVPHLTEAAGNSFPSGHSFNSAVVFIAIALAFADEPSAQRPLDDCRSCRGLDVADSVQPGLAGSALSERRDCRLAGRGQLGLPGRGGARPTGASRSTALDWKAWVPPPPWGNALNHERRQLDLYDRLGLRFPRLGVSLCPEWRRCNNRRRRSFSGACRPTDPSDN